MMAPVAVLVHVLQEHVGQGVRVRGVFRTPDMATSAARKLAEKRAHGTEHGVGVFLRDLIVSTFALDQVVDE